MAKEIGEIIGVLGALYFLFDFFLWNGGILDPSIIARITAIGTVLWV
jgi:hypothetical protein